MWLHGLDRRKKEEHLRWWQVYPLNDSHYVSLQGTKYPDRFELGVGSDHLNGHLRSWELNSDGVGSCTVEISDTGARAATSVNFSVALRFAVLERPQAVYFERRAQIEQATKAFVEGDFSCYS